MEKKLIAYVRTDGIYNDSRATKEIQTLLKNGYSVLVIGWDRNGRALENCINVFEKEACVEYAFFENTLNHIGVRNIDKLVKWFIFVFKTLKKNSDRIIAVHACNLDLLEFCQKKFCKKYAVPLVYDIYDYYIDAHRIPNKLVKFIENMEIKTINCSNLCIICTEERKRQISKANPKKLIVIHNSPLVDREVFEKASTIMYDYFYCGVLGGGRLLSEIISANNGDYRMGFVGYGDFMREILNDDYGNFDYLGEIQYSKCLELEKQSICLSAIYEPTYRNHKLCAPNKFYEALALGKPVIVCRGTGIDKIVEKYDLGKVIDYDSAQFYDAINFFKNNEEYCNGVKTRARKIYEEHYAWNIMSKRLIDAYNLIIINTSEDI